MKKLSKVQIKCLKKLEKLWLEYIPLEKWETSYRLGFGLNTVFALERRGLIERKKIRAWAEDNPDVGWGWRITDLGLKFLKEHQDG